MSIEIKTLKQGIHHDQSLAAFDQELAAHLNEGWEIIPSLSAISDNFSMGGSEGTSYQLRIVTMRRPLPLTSVVAFNACLALVKAIEVDHPFLPGQAAHDDVLAFAAYAWRRHGEHYALLKAVELFQEDHLTSDMRTAFVAAQAAFAAYEASEKERD